MYLYSSFEFTMVTGHKVDYRKNVILYMLLPKDGTLLFLSTLDSQSLEKLRLFYNRNIN